MISLRNIRKEIPEGVLLDDISFTLGNKEKVAILGQNGCGKSTLLKVLVFEEDVDGGAIHIENERVAYLPQLFSFPDTTLKEFGLQQVGGDPSAFYKIEKYWYQFGLTSDWYDVPVNALSSGQQIKVKLSSLLLDDPSVLILDEPTNHLDIEGIAWMETYVQSFDGIVLMVSHDRSFLDATVDTIFEIDEKRLHVFPGNYTDYLKQKGQWVEERDKTYKRQEKKREQMEQLIENARKIKGGKSRGKAVKAAKKRMEREVLSNEVAKYERKVLQDVDFSGETHTGKLMLRIDHVHHAFDGQYILHDINLEIRGNERVWLYGPNGTGKSTMLNIVTGIFDPTHGSSVIGVSVRWGYFRQNQEHFNFSQRVGEYILAQTGLIDFQQYALLEKLLFPKAYQSKRIGSLSPGERARLAFGVFSQQPLDFLILDEPTNHLDIWTKEVIESSLRDYEGALLLVSHDRFFVEKVGIERILSLEEKTIVESLEMFS